VLNYTTTNKPNELWRLVTDDNGERDIFITAEEYSAEQAALFERLASAAYANKNIDELNYKRLMGSVEINTDIDEALDHFADLFEQFKQIMRDDIQTRILKGADYIDTHGALPTAVKRYDKLCEDLDKLDGRWSDARQDQTN